MFKLQIALDNAAFHDDDNMHAEISRILREAADRVGQLHWDGTCRDHNGNKVGTWSIDSAPNVAT